MSFNKSCLLVLTLSLFSFGISAHPHSWIALDTTVNVQDGNIVSLSMEWEFDAMTSAYMLADEKIDASNRDETYNRIANEIVENMLSNHYFTYFYQGEEPIRYKKAEGGELVQKGAKLTLSFELELAKPVALETNGLSLLIFDPTYFVDMSWDSKQSIKLSQPYSDACNIDIIKPNPTAEQLAYAMSLSMDEDPDYELGQLFTQRAKFRCKPE
ncbi:DUF1007 family protein [Vibrio hannami]|uniref:DUF1007 family protein n=1 Tax=Vibrio hannami TaxID=2717094 RepID=UPI0024104B2D|nr:DUF1007 family protein [Vibrio hannami]MDG3087909.1 DUF1007 family protein [Vibrio hannami]